MKDIDKYADTYEKILDFEQIQVKFRKKIIMETIKKYRPEKILEVGCGLEPFFLERIQWKQYTVIEPAKKFANNAKLLAEKKSLKNINIIQGFLEEFTNWRTDFDFIIVSSVLHEVPNVDKFLRSLLSIANKNTIIHINVPNSNSLHRLIAYEAGLISRLDELTQRNKELQQYRVFSLDSLEKLLKKYGCDIIEKGSYFLKPFTHNQMQNLLENKLIDLRILEGLYKVTKYCSDYGSEIFINVRLK